MSVCAVVQDGTGLVTNLIMAVPSDPWPEGETLISDPPPECQIGWTWNGSEFVDPNVPPPVNPVEGLDML